MDPSVTKRTEGGQQTTWIRPKYLVLASTWAHLSASEKDSLLSAFDSVGVGTPVILSLDPTNVDLTAYGYLQNTAAKHEQANRWTYGPAFQEAL
jgi:hypothetical protein